MSNDECFAFMEKIGMPLTDDQKTNLIAKTAGATDQAIGGEPADAEEVSVEDVEEVSPEMKKKIDQVTKDLIKNLD